MRVDCALDQDRGGDDGDRQSVDSIPDTMSILEIQNSIRLLHSVCCLKGEREREA